MKRDAYLVHAGIAELNIEQFQHVFRSIVDHHNAVSFGLQWLIVVIPGARGQRCATGRDRNGHFLST